MNDLCDDSDCSGEASTLYLETPPPSSASEPETELISIHATS